MHTIERERQIWLLSGLDWNMVMLCVATVSMKTRNCFNKFKLK